MPSRTCLGLGAEPTLTLAAFATQVLCLNVGDALCKGSAIMSRCPFRSSLTALGSSYRQVSYMAAEGAGGYRSVCPGVS